MKTVTFRINGQNIEQEFGIQVTFITEKMPQKERFSAKNSQFGDFCIDFEPLLGWECVYLWHNIRTKKESIYGK